MTKNPYFYKGRHRKVSPVQIRYTSLAGAALVGVVLSQSTAHAATIDTKPGVTKELATSEKNAETLLAVPTLNLTSDTTRGTTSRVVTKLSPKSYTSSSLAVDQKSTNTTDLAKLIDDFKGRVESLKLDSVRPAEGVITTGFEMRWGTFHDGIDVANALGTPIYAAEDGIVISAGPASGYGKWVRIQHEDGTVTLYGHMNTIDVSVGEKVVAGQKIAGMGSQGFSTGSHLHFGVYTADGTAVNPFTWLSERGIEY